MTVVKDIEFYIKSFVSIYYGEKLLCSGKIINIKKFINSNELYIYISVDNHTFFNINSDKFKINLSDRQINLYTADILPNTLKIRRLKTINAHCVPKGIDIILDNDINHLDKHVDELVYALNKLGIVTDGSCSGHYEKYLWISCQFESLDKVILIKKIIFKYFRNDFYLSTQKDREVTTDTKLGLSIVSYHKGKSAYRAANRLATYLNNYFC